jgi:tetratricopeptide (TPR) repeat protein
MSVTTNEERMKVKVVRPLLQVSTNKDSRVYSGNVSFKTLRPLTPASLKYYDLALRWFNKLIAITTGNAFRESASIQKSEIFTDIKEPLLSLESYGFFIRTFPQSKNTPDVMVRRGDVYLDLGKYDESFRTYQEFLELYPKADKRDYVKLKMDYLRMITSRENAALVPSILTELDKQKKQMEALETELKKKEDRLNNLDQIRKQ